MTLLLNRLKAFAAAKRTKSYGWMAGVSIFLMVLKMGPQRLVCQWLQQLFTTITLCLLS